MHDVIRIPQCYLILALLLTATGCSRGPAIAEVSGVVKIDGKPMPFVRVMFMPDPLKGTVGPGSGGFTDDQGHFTLTCDDERPGAVVGWHKVVLFDSNQNLYRTPRNGRRDDDDPVIKVKARPKGPKVPERYTNSGKTPLNLEVKATKNELELALTAR